MTVFRRRRGRPGLRFIALGTVVAVLVVGCAVEAVMRHQLAGRFDERMGKKVGTSLDVDLGVTPVVWQLAQGSFEHVQVSGDDATFRRFSGVSFDADLESVERRDDGLTINNSQVRAILSYESLGASVGQMTGQQMVVTANPETSELIMHTGPGGRLSIVMRPTLDGDEIKLERGDVMFGERPIPPALADQLLAQAPQNVDLSGLPLALTPSDLAVTDEGLRLDLQGERTTIQG